MSFNPSTWTSDAWSTFLQDHWILIAVAIVAIFFIVKMVQTVMKWVIVLAIVFGLVAYGGYSINDLKAVGAKVTSTLTNELKDEAIKAAAGEANQATYKDNGDGTYTVKTPNLELTGVPNSGEVSVKFKGVSLGKWKMEGAVRDLVVKARGNA